MKTYFEKRVNPITVDENLLLSSAPHCHNEIELVYVKSGSSLAYADNNCFKINAGDIFIAFPNQIHYYKECIQGCYYVVIFSSDLIYGQKAALYGNVPENNMLTDIPQLNPLALRLIESYKKNKMTECVGYLNLLMGVAIDNFKLLPSIATDNSTLRNVLEYCAKNYADNLSLDLIAEHMNLSKYYISHLFNRKLDLGFNDYIKMLRVRAACDLLLESNKKIADISEDVGFGTIRSLNRAFKEVMNKTPMEYREMQGLKET